MTADSPDGVVVTGPAVPGSDRILTAEALAFVADLQRRFAPSASTCSSGGPSARPSWTRASGPTSSSRTAEVRESDWVVAPAPADLDDRRVEITGPAEPKMMINALNSGARVFMADLEDALSPTLGERRRGPGRHRRRGPRHADLRLAGRQGLPAGRRHAPRSSSGPVAGTWSSRTCSSTTCRCRPRCSTSVCTSSTRARRRSRRGSGPYVYLPKLESHHEARLWNDVFLHAQDALGIPRGSVRATVLIETILAAFEMDEILYELREHAAGLNAGRWDYLFSAIKKFRTDPAIASPDRAQLTMTVPFMRAYTELLVQTCHRRGAHAIGGMAAFIPNRRDPGRHRDRAREGPRRQGPREPRRLRRHVGRPSGPRAGGARGVRWRPRRTARTRRSDGARRSRSSPRTCST